METPKKRKPNWSKDETLMLTELVGPQKSVLEGKFAPGISSSRKRETWETITSQLNSQMHNHRSKEEVEKKWKNLKTQSRKSFSTFHRQTVGTGGGPAPEPMSPITDSVVDIMGRSNVSLTGIQGSIDTTEFLFSTLEEPCDVERSPSVRVLLQQPHVEPPPLPQATSCDCPTSETTILKNEKLRHEIDCLKLTKRLLELKIKKMEE